MTKKKAMLATACFCFALAFALVLGTAEQPRANVTCCHIDCTYPAVGPGGDIGLWNENLHRCQYDPIHHDQYGCWLNPFSCAMIW